MVDGWCRRVSSQASLLTDPTLLHPNACSVRAAPIVLFGGAGLDFDFHQGGATTICDPIGSFRGHSGARASARSYPGGARSAATSPHLPTEVHKANLDFALIALPFENPGLLVEPLFDAKAPATFG